MNFIPVDNHFGLEISTSLSVADLWWYTVETETAKVLSRLLHGGRFWSKMADITAHLMDWAQNSVTMRRIQQGIWRIALRQCNWYMMNTELSHCLRCMLWGIARIIEWLSLLKSMEDLANGLVTLNTSDCLQSRLCVCIYRKYFLSFNYRSQSNKHVNT